MRVLLATLCVGMASASASLRGIQAGKCYKQLEFKCGLTEGGLDCEHCVKKYALNGKLRQWGCTTLDQALLFCDIVNEEETKSTLGKKFWQKTEKSKIAKNDWKKGNLDATWSQAKSTKLGKDYFKQLDSEVNTLEAKMAKLLKNFEKTNPVYKIDEDESLKNGKDESWADVEKSSEYKNNKKLQKVEKQFKDKTVASDLKMEERDFLNRMQNMVSAVDNYCGTTASCTSAQVCCNEQCCKKYKGFYCTKDKKACLGPSNFAANVKLLQPDANTVDCGNPNMSGDAKKACDKVKDKAPKDTAPKSPSIPAPAPATATTVSGHVAHHGHHKSN